MTQISVFLAASLDGYIATADDDLSWLEAAVGGGRPLFHPLSAPTPLVLEDVQAFPSGMVNLRNRRASRRPV